MERITEVSLEGIILAVDEVGSGEPVVLIHGALIADAFQPLLREPALAGSYRLITYRRRGYEGSSSVSGSFSLQEQASDCAGIIRHLGLKRTHLVGHSFGGAVALQLALDEPDMVGSLTLLEPALMVGASGPAYRESLENGIRQYQTGETEAVVHSMLSARWPDYRDSLERELPGAFKQAVKDSHASFEVELPSLLGWRFGDDEAVRVKQPVLSVIGEMSASLSPRFEESHRWLLDHIEQAEAFVLPGAHHFLQIENSTELASHLADFLARNPL